MKCSKNDKNKELINQFINIKENIIFVHHKNAHSFINNILLDG